MSLAYTELPPGARLAQYVDCYWSLQVRGESPSNRVLPDGCVDILLSKHNAQPVALTVVGLMTVPFIVPVQPGNWFLGVRFRPGMGSAFIPEVAALTNKSEPLESFWGARARLLLNRLAESTSLEEMVQVIEPELRPLEPADALDRALSQLSPGNLEVCRLASDHGMSPRHFRRRCQVRSGVSPKLLSRIIRFQRAVQRIGGMKDTEAKPNWAHFAAAGGYYDQAHFIREFQAFSGVTPGRFVQSTFSAPRVESECEREA